jgi:hypothetical protein
MTELYPSPSEAASPRIRRSLTIQPASISSTQQTPGNDSKTTTVPNPQSGLRTSSKEIKLKQLVPPTPRQPSKCPLFCCFYAEFDNKVGPKVSYQAPRQFMEQEIHIPVEKIHTILSETFDRLQKSPPFSTSTNDHLAMSTAGPSETATESSNTATTSPTVGAAATTTTIDTSNQQQPDADTYSSIFGACSEYIITGTEHLSGKIVNLSTHGVHCLTRPTVIKHDRYERNALLFCLGFVIRRTEDPRPFRPVLSKLADTLRDMETESQFLSSSSNNNTNKQLQHILEWTLLSLNSATWECNLHLDSANILNLKLFHPPKHPALAVAEYAVPVLLRRDSQGVQIVRFPGACCTWRICVVCLCVYTDTGSVCSTITGS